MTVEELSSLVTTTVTVAVPPVRAWEALTAETSRWWTEPYLPAGLSMHLEPRLGGEVWSQPDHADGPRELHGTIRHFEPNLRLVVGGVLVPGAFSGSIEFTITKTSFGADVGVVHEVLGEPDADRESELVLGWTTLLARFGEVAEG